ncbi:MAG: hypothetical protein LAO19_00560 [Acidobacteriia bacterium]|nr:hypothetical protein [Terriglobia bacterium]
MQSIGECITGVNSLGPGKKINAGNIGWERPTGGEGNRADEQGRNTWSRARRMKPLEGSKSMLLKSVPGFHVDEFPPARVGVR